MSNEQTRWSWPIIFLLLPLKMLGQVNEDQVGAWYMYFWNTTLNESAWGFQGDFQYRDWSILGDQEQLLLRGGATYQPPDADLRFTLGSAYIGTGDFGPGKNIVREGRIYQEILLPQKAGQRFYITHRFRYEQRFVENQNFRTRWRYTLFLNIPLNHPSLQKGAVYLALYNELFINGQRDIGNETRVEFFDRNRSYAALGYNLSSRLRIQTGMMRQTTTAWKKWQLQISLHHTL